MKTHSITENWIRPLASHNFTTKVTEWSNKWLAQGQINDQIADWVINKIKKAKPDKAFGTVKTHKDGTNPLRLITSCCGTAIERLSELTEFYF